MNAAIKFFAISILALIIPLKGVSHIHTSNCIASPEPVTIQQPDGSELTIIGKGNMEQSFTETIDGYTLIRNNTGFYVYAESDESGTLTPSGIKATDPEMREADDREYLNRIEQHLRPELQNAQKREIPPQDHHHDHQIFDDEFDHDHIAASNFPSTGSHRVLLLLIEYPDLPAQYSLPEFDALMNEENYNGTGSFRDYYLETSDGALDLSVDVFGWYQADNGYLYYGNENGTNRTRELVAQAVDAAQAEGVDFSMYDNNGDGEVDGILVVHSGPGAEEGSRRQYIWSHRSSLGSNFDRHYDGVRINNYGIQPETRGGSNTRMVGIGIFAHEFGHILGLPDLYDTSHESAGIGQWGVMGSGSWLDNEHSPAHFSPWSKIDLGWVEPTLLEYDQEVSLKAVSESNEIYKINTGGVDYFLVEARQPVNFDRALPGKGLAIWHINMDVLAIHRNRNRVNNDTSKFGVGLIQADNLRQLENDENRGNMGDLYPGITNNQAFSHDSSPAARSADGNYAGFGIYNIEDKDSVVTFNFSITPFVRFSVNASHNICVNTPLSLSNHSKHLNNFEWDFGDGNTSTNTEPSHSYNETGEFEVTLKAYDDEGNESEYSRIVNVKPKPVADFDMELINGKVQFTNYSEGATEYNWTINGESFDSKDISYSYNPGSKNRIVRLEASSSFQCNDSKEKTLPYYFGFRNLANLYPNPVDNQMNVLVYNSNDNQEVKFQLFSLKGQKVLSHKSSFNAESGFELFEIPVTGLSPSIYLLEVTTGDEREIIRAEIR